MANLFDVLFGCHHKNFSFPITRKSSQRRNDVAPRTGTYVCCLDCGKEFAYDWKHMKVLEDQPRRFKAVAASAAESYAGK